MDDMPVVALLTIRTWLEEGSSDPLRAEIRMTGDVSSGFQTVEVVAKRERVMDAVKAFLDGVFAA
ncbi:MAG TPA: hypothetical protein VFY54_11080 [Rubrobacter sp.]|nr:hypothetical protein [Rubrobacter sp.]